MTDTILSVEALPALLARLIRTEKIHLREKDGIISLSPISETSSVVAEDRTYISSGEKRLGCMKGHGFVGRDVDIKAIGREEIIAMFEDGE